jgi:hypothetical protein
MSGKNPLPHELAYQGVKAVNPPDVIVSRRDPNVTDTKYQIGTFWINTETNQSYQLLDAPGVWVLISASAGVSNVVAGDNIVVAQDGDTATVSTSMSPTFNSVTTNGSIYSNGTIRSLNTGIVAEGGSITTEQGGFSAPNGSLEVRYNITASQGNISADGGDAVIRLRGFRGQYQLNGAALESFIGQDTLAAGTVTIANAGIAPGDRIFVQRTSNNASTTLGELGTSINAGVSFTVKSSIVGTPGSTQAGDLSSFDYFIVRQL